MLGRAGSDVGAAFPVCRSRGHLLFLFLILPFCTVEAIVLAPVYWNSSNPIFKSSKNDHMVEVNPGDDIDFICPYYPPGDDDQSNFEYYLIYSVPESEYKLCSLSTEASLILNCSQPQQRRRYTIIFETHQSIPNAPEYKPGQTYFYITTSTSGLEGLNNADHGACHQQNMKLMVRINSDSNNPDYFFFDDNYNDIDNDLFLVTETPRPPTRRHHQHHQQQQHQQQHNNNNNNNKRPHMGRPPTFEDHQQQPIVPRHRGHKSRGHEGNNRRISANQQQQQQEQFQQHQQQQQKSHRRQTQKNLTTPDVTVDQRQRQQQQQQQQQQQPPLGGHKQQVGRGGGKEIFHSPPPPPPPPPPQVPGSALSSSSGGGGGAPVTSSLGFGCFTIFGYAALFAGSV